MIDQGVRQIAILADDFWNPGGPNGVRLLNDMTAWLEEVKKQYPDMKMTILMFRMTIWATEAAQNFRS